jgi:phosphopantothenoylcysteine decarboxylase/phosphopantothenate--cysteine ligase
MTKSASEFVSSLTLSTLTNSKVICELAEEGQWSNHVMNGRWADLFLIAPLTCNSLSKMAHGICDNMLMATYFSATCPVMIAPAMDEDMWLHPSTQRNLELIKNDGVEVLEVGSGDLASGLVGKGRMAEPEEIVLAIEQKLCYSGELSGKRFLVTAGPTYELIDPVRFIGNHSTGKMGIAIAKELVKRGGTVELVLGPVSMKVEYKGIRVHHVVSADEMYQQCMRLFPDTNCGIMAAAVADYRPVTTSDIKIKKKEEEFSIALKRTRDVLNELGKIKTEGQLLVGFALETNAEKENALKKMHQKNADMIVLNSLNDQGAGFGYDTNKVTIFNRNGAEFHSDLKTKELVAKDIVDQIIKQYA